MSELLTYDQPWKRIASLVKKNPGRCSVAVAYFGTGASELLPLKKGSTLVVDVSEGAVRSSQTNPSEVLKLVNKGVDAYSVSNLHAKVFVIGQRVLVGSTNASNTSAHGLVEAVVETNERAVTAQCRRFVMGLRAEPATADYLKRLRKFWNPPAFGGGRGARKGKPLPVVAEHGPLWVIPMEYTTYNEDDEKAEEKGRKKARSRIRSPRLHELDDFKLDLGWMNSLKRNDLVIQVFDEGKKTYMVTPPERVLEIERCKKGHARPAIVQAESRRDWKRKNLRLVLKKLPPSGKILKLTGRAQIIHDALLAHALIKLWA